MSLKLINVFACMAVAYTGAINAKTTLASWTFESGYESSNGDGLHKIYTPNDSEWTKIGATWFKDVIPVILPDECTGEKADYSLSAFSENRYWEITSGYNTNVFRIENTGAENNCTDYTNPTQHKAYYEISFPTKGYKGISIDYAIAPGNNSVTPIRLVLSTDGGLTWTDAGSNDTGNEWWLYTNTNVNVSAGNKDNVIARLIPSVGTTNWNLDYLKISADEKIESDIPINVSGASIKWPFDKGADNETAANLSTPEAFSVADYALGSNLYITGVRSDNGLCATLISPTDGGNMEDNDKNALIFQLKPKKGLTFKPKKLSFQASKVGTNGGKLDVGITIGDKEIFVVKDFNPQLAKEPPYYSLCEYDLTELGDATDIMSVKIYIKELANKKEYAFQNIEITGDISGTIEDVPSYTFQLNTAVDDAGNLSCSPAGNEFDEGTMLTISASENFGYHFTSWTDATGNIVSTDNPYTFEINENTALTANFDKKNVYALNLAINRGANVNQVLYTPEGHVVDGVHYYEEDTDVILTTVNNRVIAFTNWEDNSTSPVREIKMDGEKNLTATFSADDYIVGWDFYFDQPSSERAADYKSESDNAGLLSLRNQDGVTTSWLTRGVSNGAENGKWGARIWKNLTAKNYFELSFSSTGYKNIKLSASLGASYNTYSVINTEYSTDGKNFTKFGTYKLQKGWVSQEIALPSEASDQKRIWIRFMPDYTSPLIGNTSDYDGLCISDLYIIADVQSSVDLVAPQLVHSIPADKSDGASASGSIILTFDEKVKVGTGEATLNGKTLTPTASGKNIIYTYKGLAYNTLYTFTVPEGAITDRSGNKFAGTTISFSTMERLQPESRLFDAIVAKDGTGDYSSVQSAIDAAPANRVKPWLIFVKNGDYKEHVDIPADKPMIHLIGQDRDKAIILDDKLCGGDNALHVSVGATVVVNSNDCLFENITLENSYGHKTQSGPQALALNTIGDRTVFNNVAMLSYQDTWITPSTSNYRAYVRNSLIEGAVDFIYNSGNIFIDKTTLYINRKSGGYIVAPSHTSDVEWGYVFNNCTITAPGVPSETSVWLGRPWHNSPKTVFLNTRAEVTIPATGWYETMGGLPSIWADWNTVDGNGNPVDLSQRRDTYYRIENNEKIYGKAKNFLTDEEAAQYTVDNVLSGNDNWQPVIKTEPCATPVATIKDGAITWEAVPYAICYLVTSGDKVIGFTTDTSMTIDTDLSPTASYSVQAVNEFGGLSEKAFANDSSSINDIDMDTTEGTIIGIYDIYGHRLREYAKGLNIVHRCFPDGKVKIEKIIF